MEDKKNTKK